MSLSLDTKLSQLTLVDHIFTEGGSGVRPMAKLGQLLLGATELVEIILLDDNLRKDDLMRVRRVCRRLRVIVDGTLSLRSKLFLAPVYNIPPKSVGFVAAPSYRDCLHQQPRYSQLRDARKQAERYRPVEFQNRNILSPYVPCSTPHQECGSEQLPLW